MCRLAIRLKNKVYNISHNNISKDFNGVCPLHVSCERGNANILKILLEHPMIYTRMKVKGYFKQYK